MAERAQLLMQAGVTNDARPDVHTAPALAEVHRHADEVNVMRHNLAQRRNYTPVGYDKTPRRERQS